MKKVLQKFIADSGYCSRRKAEELIRNKKVKLNGEIAKLGERVDDDDEVTVNNKRIKEDNKKVYIVLNKPLGYTCTSRKFKNEKNVFDLVRTEERLFVVGRLDKDSRGLVLLTNDGDLTQRLTHPKYGHEKEYIVEISNLQPSISKQFIDDLIFKFKKGVDIGEGDGIVRVKDIKYLEKNKFRMILTEGKKRQIRRMFKEVGLKIESLERTRIGNINLKNLPVGEYKKIEKI